MISRVQRHALIKRLRTRKMLALVGQFERHKDARHWLNYIRDSGKPELFGSELYYAQKGIFNKSAEDTRTLASLMSIPYSELMRRSVHNVTFDIRSRWDEDDEYY